MNFSINIGTRTAPPEVVDNAPEEQNQDKKDDSTEETEKPENKEPIDVYAARQKYTQNQIVLAIIIEDYIELQCVRTLKYLYLTMGLANSFCSMFFDLNLSCREVLHQIAKKPSVLLDLSGEKEAYFEIFLVNTTTNEKTWMEKHTQLKSYNLKNKV